MRLDNSRSKASEPRPTQAEIKIGAKVKDYRRARQLTLQQLGQYTGLSRSFLSKLENGQVSPSIPTLIKVATALGTTVSDLLDGLTGVSEGNLVVVRALRRSIVARGGSSFGYSYERLAHRKSSTFEAFIVRFTRGRKPAKPFVHEGYEFNYVLKGSIELVHGDQCLVLNEGDSVYFDSSIPHYGLARGAREAQVLAVLITHDKSQARLHVPPADLADRLS